MSAREILDEIERRAAMRQRDRFDPAYARQAYDDRDALVAALRAVLDEHHPDRADGGQTCSRCGDWYPVTAPEPNALGRQEGAPVSHIDIEQVASEAFGAGWTCVDAGTGYRSYGRDAAKITVWHGPKGRVSAVDINRDSEGSITLRSYFSPNLAEKLRKILRSGNTLGADQ